MCAIVPAVHAVQPIARCPSLCLSASAGASEPGTFVPSACHWDVENRALHSWACSSACLHNWSTMKHCAWLPSQQTEGHAVPRYLFSVSGALPLAECHLRSRVHSVAEDWLSRPSAVSTARIRSAICTADGAWNSSCRRESPAKPGSISRLSDVITTGRCKRSNVQEAQWVL